eukprot:GAFH01001947.1.p2 GENE.GAFH01001947.1~~GAFH01001947.1.p2  ORF type:complete len:441 (-),score=115.13 GAFH01001947.1:32-1330(-)
MSLLSLHPDLLARIMGFCTPTTLVSLIRTCKKFKDLSARDDVWRMQATLLAKKSTRVRSSKKQSGSFDFFDTYDSRLTGADCVGRLDNLTLDDNFVAGIIGGPDQQTPKQKFTEMFRRRGRKCHQCGLKNVHPTRGTAFVCAHGHKCFFHNVCALPLVQEVMQARFPFDKLAALIPPPPVDIAALAPAAHAAEPVAATEEADDWEAALEMQEEAETKAAKEKLEAEQKKAAAEAAEKARRDAVRAAEEAFRRALLEVDLAVPCPKCGAPVQQIVHPPAGTRMLAPPLPLPEMIRLATDRIGRQMVMTLCAPYVVHTVLHGDVHHYIAPQHEQAAVDCIGRLTALWNEAFQARNKSGDYVPFVHEGQPDFILPDQAASIMARAKPGLAKKAEPAPNPSPSPSPSPSPAPESAVPSRAPPRKLESNGPVDFDIF